MRSKFIGFPGRNKAVRVQIHADTKGCSGFFVGGCRKRDCQPACRRFSGPCFIRVVEMGLAVVGQDISSRGNSDSRIVGYARRW